MKKITRLLIVLLLAFNWAIAQDSTATAQDKVYRAEREKINDLVHTKLKVRFDFAKRQLIGEEWVTLKPHFYNVQAVTLDAKAMDIKKVEMDGKPLKYDYDGKLLNIKLNNIFTKDEPYTLYISYVANPEKVQQEGSAAITDAKGLYFIDPDGTDPDKPTEIWTQGETESNSCWFPTIDSPNQKTTEEIYMTVPDKYVTLSNGVLESQTKNNDGTRTDYWKLDQKHAPYLFFMGVGDFSIVKDKWRDIPVNYYVEKEYEPYAKGIFGNTPEMIEFYSNITGVPYVWPKYDQMVGRDYVSGAMENTTAVLHAENAFQTDGQLIDENVWEDVIAHELFHHWFGDLVTTESWANITVNESFANYSEYLWREHKYGKDHADALRYKDLQGYFMNEGNAKKDLVRFYYKSREDVFDAVSYNKGGYILHMLRHFLGDKAFFAGLHEYLIENQYGTAEAQQLRLALEKVSGKDLNWFFNQWYYGAGNPVLDISYQYNTGAKSVTVTIKQSTDKAYQFPLDIDVYETKDPKRYSIWVKDKEEQFTIKYNTKPALIDIDPDKTLLAEITDNKSLENSIYQYSIPKANYLDRRQAIETVADHQDNAEAMKVLIKALNDPYYGLRLLALDKIKVNGNKDIINIIKKLAVSDEKTLVRAKAIQLLGDLNDPVYIPLFKEALKNKSYAMQNKAMNALYKLDKQAAIDHANSITNKLDKEGLAAGLAAIYINEQNEKEMPFIAKRILQGLFFTQDTDEQALYGNAFRWIASSDNVVGTQALVDDFVDKANRFKRFGADAIIKQMLQQVLMAKQQLNSPNKDQLIAIVNNGIAAIK